MVDEDVPEEVEEESPAVEEPESVSEPPSAPSPTVVDPDVPSSVRDGQNEPGEGFTEETVTIRTMTMNMGFDANGEAGSPGDKLAYVEGHWFIIRKAG